MDVQKSERLRRLPPYLAVEIQRKVREARRRGVDVISLGVGEPDRATPPHIVDALSRAASQPSNQKYPPGGTRGIPEFRESVAAWYGSRFGVHLDPGAEVHSLIGSKEGNHHLALALLDPGDVAIVPDPAYPAYAASAIIAGAQVRRLPLRSEDAFLPDLDRISPSDARAAKLMWLNYPNNPTTAVASLGFYRRVVDFARRHDITVVSDNPYSEIAFDGVRAPSILQVDGAKDVAVELNSLSKTYSMTGWRIGMAVGNENVIAAMAAAKSNTDTGVFTALQHAGIAALDGPQDVVRDSVADYRRRRDLVVGTLREIGFAFDPPKATLYVWAPIPTELPSREFSARLLDLAGVFITPGADFGVQGEGFVRLSLGIPDARLEEALQRMREVKEPLLNGPAAHPNGKSRAAPSTW